MREFQAGFVAFGEVNTPRDAIDSRAAAALLQLRELGYTIVDAGTVTDDEEYREADAAVEKLEAQGLDALIVCIAGWVPTHAVIRVIDRFRHLPMLLWSLCGWEKDGKLISTADQAGATALAPAMKGLGYRFTWVYNSLHMPAPMERIADWLSAASAAAGLRGACIGSCGYRDMLLYGTMYDGMSLRREIGTEIEHFELLEVVQEAEKIPEAAVKETVAFIRAAYKFTKDCDDAPLIQCAKYALAIARKIRKRNYKAISLIDVDGFKKLLGLPPAMIFMLLDRLCGVCVIPENDIPGSVTQLMVHLLTGQSAVYLEFYEFFEDALLCGVPDFITAEATMGDATIQPAAFGLLNTSLLNVSKVHDGEVTLVRLQADNGKYRLHLVKGEARQPRPWEECGWDPPAPQLPSLEVVPEGGVEHFKELVGGQHIIVAFGDQTRRIRDLAAILGIEVVS